MFFFTQYILGQDYLWQTPLLWLHTTTDLLLAIIYCSVPLCLFYFVRKQQGRRFSQIFILFSLFIFSGAITHLTSLWRLWYPDYWSGIIKAIAALIAGYTAIELIKFFPVALNFPDPQVLAKVNQDLDKEIESRIKVELELEKERSFLKATLNSLTDGVAACNAEGILTLFNPASQKLFGEQEPLKSQQWSQHYHLYYPDGKNYVRQEDLPLFRAYKGETMTDVELMVIPPHQAPRLLSINGCPIIDANGAKLGAVVTIRDITESKQTEQRLKKLNTELLHSNRELEQFAYVASHDLREPLRMVISFTQLLAQRYRNQLDDEADKIIGFAVDGAKRMEKLIEDLLLFSRLNKHGKAASHVDFNRVLQSALANLNVLIQETNAEITVDESLPQVIGDEIQFIQLWQNLIVNAIVYCKVQPKIEIRAVAQKSGWLFSIKDNGIGINPSNAQRIFEVFQRLHPKEQYSGTGIGLAICKKIIESHDGQIWVESALNSGSVFKFTLNSQNK